MFNPEKYNTTMKKYTIEPSEDVNIIELMERELFLDIPAEEILSAGGVWFDEKRIFDPLFIVPKCHPVKIVTSDNQNVPFEIDDESVVFEHDDFIIINKPGGISVHNDFSSIKNNLTHAVSSYLKRKGMAYETYPITRLDYGVSGLTIYAKNKDGERELFHLTRERKIKKIYVAVLEKDIDFKCMRIKSKISFHWGRACEFESGKDAHSLFIKRGSVNGYTVASVMIFTGRRHQIRFHASQNLASVLGDIYYDAGCNLTNRKIGLFAYGYNIPYKGEKIRIRLPEIDRKIKEFVDIYTSSRDSI